MWERDDGVRASVRGEARVPGQPMRRGLRQHLAAQERGADDSVRIAASQPDWVKPEGFRPSPPASFGLMRRRTALIHFGLHCQTLEGSPPGRRQRPLSQPFTQCRHGHEALPSLRATRHP